MKKTILTAMLFFGFSFLMVVGLNAQSDGAQGNYLNGLPTLVQPAQAKTILKTEIVNLTSSLAALESNQTAYNLAVNKINLFDDTYTKIYRENMSTKDAVIAAYGNSKLAIPLTSGSSSGPVTVNYSGSSIFQELVNMLKE